MKQLAAYTADLKDLESKVNKYVQSASTLAADAEKLAAQSDKVCGCIFFLALISSQVSMTSNLGRSTDRSRVGPAVASLKDMGEKCKADLASALAELKAIDAHIAERHKEGANMASLKKKAETLEGKNDPKATVARSEADRAEEVYVSKHDVVAAELKAWKDNAGSRYSNIFDQVEAIVGFLYRG